MQSRIASARAESKETSMKFVDMWILSCIEFDQVPLRLLLFDRRELREQWKPNCNGITPTRVKSSILHLCSTQELQIFRLDQQSGCNQQFIRVPTADAAETMRRSSIDELRDSNLFVSVTSDGFESWNKWSAYDWSNHSAFELDPDDYPSVDGPGWIDLRCASWRKMIFEIRHAPDLNNVMLQAIAATCSIRPLWAISEMLTLPWCFHLRARAIEIGFTSDALVDETECSSESLCSELEKEFVKWESSEPVPTDFSITFNNA